MKKLMLLTFFSLFTGLLINASDTISSNGTLLENMPPEQITAVERIYVDFTQKIEEMAHALRIPAEQIWATLVVKNKLEGQINLLLFPLLILFLLISFIFLTRYTRRNWQNLYDAGSEIYTVFGCVILGGLLVAFTIVLFVNISDYILRIKTPEYFALKEIMGFF